MIIEARSDLGGTWDQMKFPGVRSDTDMYNYGFTFNPWQGPIIAQGSDIKAYLTDTAKSLISKSIYYLILRLHHYLGVITSGLPKLALKISPVNT